VSDLFYFDTKPNLKCPTAKTIYIQQRGLSVQAPLRLLLYWRQAQESGFNLWRGLAVTSILASGTTPTTLFWSSDRNRKWKVWLIRNSWGTKNLPRQQPVRNRPPNDFFRLLEVFLNPKWFLQFMSASI